MSINNDGFSGVDIEQIALEKNVLVGVQAPNINPVVVVLPTGTSLPKAAISENGGMLIEPYHGLNCLYIDTSWLCHGGIYGMTSGNKMNFVTGAGGFEYISCGPSKFNTAFVDFLTTYAFNVNTRLFTVSVTERAHLMGKRIDFDFDETYFTGNINFINNIAMNGSLFVNGELYCTHMTSMAQINSTHPSPDLSGYINPGQSFVVFSGASKKAKQLLPAIDCMMTMPLPDGEVTLPCKISFTNGISLASDTTISQCPDTLSVIPQGPSRPCTEDISDLMGPGHAHQFIGPSCNYIKNTAGVFGEAKTMMESETPTKAKKTQPNGCSSWEEYTQQTATAALHACQQYLLNARKYVKGQFII